MRLVILESPYAGIPGTSDYARQVQDHVDYARVCMRDCLRREEAPFASHLLYTQPDVLDDTVPAERAQGIIAGLAWGDHADATVVYTDLGVSAGMAQGIERAIAAGRPVEYRRLAGWETAA